MKKTKRFHTIKILKNTSALLLAMVMLIAALPVTTIEAKKLGKIPMGHANEHPNRFKFEDDETPLTSHTPLTTGDSTVTSTASPVIHLPLP